MGIRCADHVTPLYPQKLTLTSPNAGGRSVGIVRSRTKATEFSFSFLVYMFIKEETLLHACLCTGTACQSHVPHVIGVYKILKVSPYISFINAVFYLLR